MVNFGIVLINNNQIQLILSESKFDSNSDNQKYLNPNSIKILFKILKSKTFEYQKLLVAFAWSQSYRSIFFLATTIPICVATVNF